MCKITTQRLSRHGQPKIRFALSRKATSLSYRNKTYVAFASEDIRSYRMMEAWRDNNNFAFNFHDAHDLAVARDTSLPATIRRNLRTRLNNTKQVVLLGTTTCKSKSARSSSFIYYEVETIVSLNLPVVVVNLDQGRHIDQSVIPTAFSTANYYTLSVSFQPRIIQFALDNYASAYPHSAKSGPHYYEEHIYRKLNL